MPGLLSRSKAGRLGIDASRCVGGMDASEANQGSSSDTSESRSIPLFRFSWVRVRSPQNELRCSNGEITGFLGVKFSIDTSAVKEEIVQKTSGSLER